MILVVDMSFKKGSLSFWEFVLPIVSLIKNERSLVRHRSELSIEDLNGCDRVIVSGTGLKDDEFLEQVEDFRWIRNFDKPLLGICAGMEVIGLVFGSSLFDCVEVGMRDLRLVRRNALFSSGLRAYELHSHGVQASAEFDVLAESESCVQAIKHKEKSIYGVLFHPEVRNPEVIERFALLPKKQLE